MFDHLSPLKGAMFNRLKLNVDPEELSWAKTRLSELAETISGYGRNVADQPGDLGPKQWSGQSRESLCTEMSGLGAHLNSFVGKFHNMSSAIARAERKVREAQAAVLPLNRELDELWGQDRGFSNLLKWGEICETDYCKKVERVKADEQEVLRKFAEIKDGLTDEFRLLATALQTEVIVHVSAAEVAAYQASGGTELNLMGYRSGTKPDAATARGILSAGQPLLRMRQAREDATAAVPLIERAMRGDEAAAAELKEKFGGKADDPYFAYEVTSQLGPEKLVSMAAQAALLSVGNSVDDPAVAGQAWAGAYLGRANAVASDSRRFAQSPPEFRDQVATWRRTLYLPGLVEVGKQTFTLDRQGNPVPGEPGDLSGFQVIGNVVGLGAQSGLSPGPEFMTVVGGGLAKWEYGKLTDPDDGPGLSRDLAPPHLPGVSEQIAADPASGFLAAGQLDRPAAKALLIAPASTEEPVRRYGEVLLMPKRYTQDGYSNLDGGQAVADAFSLADTDDRDQVSTQLASDFINGYGAALTEDPPTFSVPAGQVGGNGYGEKFPAYRHTAATMMSHHIADYQGVGTGTSGENPVKGEDESVGEYRDRLKTTEEELREQWVHLTRRPDADSPWKLGITNYRKTAAIVGEIGMDGPLSEANKPGQANAGQVLLTAQMAYRDQELVRLMREDSHSALAATQATATTGYFLTALAKGRMAVGVEQDAVAREQQAFIKTWVDANINNPIIDAAAGETLQRGVDGLLEKILPTDQAENEAKNAKLEEGIAEDYLNARIYEAIIWRQNGLADSPLKEWAKKVDANPDSNVPAELKLIGRDGKLISFFEMNTAQQGLLKAECRDMAEAGDLIDGLLEETPRGFGDGKAIADLDFGSYVKNPGFWEKILP